MLLSVSSLGQKYGSAIALEEIDFDVSAGSCLCILGRNGAGKTTLLRTLMGIMPPKKGTIILEGNNITHSAPHLRAQAGIGYVPQGREIFADLTVKQNIEIVLRNHAIANPENVVDEITSLFPVLSEMWRRRGGDLSGGQQQQLAIARALALKPKLLILDEPTEGIQPSVVQAIEHTIRSLKGQLAIVLVEQYYDFAQSLADNYILLDRGRIQRSGIGADMEADKISDLLTI